MGQIHVIADLRFKEDKVEEVLPLMKKMVADAKTEKGCVSYEIVQDLNNKGVFFTIEIWEKQEDLDIHLNSENIKKIMQTAQPYFAAAPDIHPCKKLY